MRGSAEGGGALKGALREANQEAAEGRGLRGATEGGGEARPDPPLCGVRGPRVSVAPVTAPTREAPVFFRRPRRAKIVSGAGGACKKFSWCLRRR